MSLNSVSLAGTVVGIPQSKSFGNQGKSLVTFMVETVDSFKGATEQHEIKAFGKSADLAMQLQDGDTVFVTGKIASRRWEKNDKVS
jgi:single-stranded DNA-binding protein